MMTYYESNQKQKRSGNFYDKKSLEIQPTRIKLFHVY